MEIPTNRRLKLEPHWKGPFEVVDRISGSNDDPAVIYRIKDARDPSRPAQVIHHNRLKPYRSGEIPAPPVSPPQTPPQLSTPNILPPSYSALSGSLPFANHFNMPTQQLPDPRRSPPTSHLTPSPNPVIRSRRRRPIRRPSYLADYDCT